MNRAIFIDKDGTLIEDVPYNVSPELIRFSEGAMEGLRQLQKMGYLLIVVSNQSGVARGYFTEDALSGVQERIQQTLNPAGIRIDGFYFCPHHPEGKVMAYRKFCHCRKPKPGMLLEAAAAHHIDLRRSWMIGDILDDVEAGNAAGCRTVLIDNGNETEWILSEKRRPTAIVADFAGAVELISHQFQFA